MIGGHNLENSGEGSLTELTIDVTKYTNHESYKTSNYDITIIELAHAVDLTTYTPACLAKTSDTTTFDGKNAWVYGEIIMLPWQSDNCYLRGWGATSYGGVSSNVLMELEVPVVTKETCTTAMADFAAINDGMICAGGVEGKDTCQVRHPQLIVISDLRLDMYII